MRAGCMKHRSMQHERNPILPTLNVITVCCGDGCSHHMCHTSIEHRQPSAYKTHMAARQSVILGPQGSPSTCLHQPLPPGQPRSSEWSNEGAHRAYSAHDRHHSRMCLHDPAPTSSSPVKPPPACVTTRLWILWQLTRDLSNTFQSQRRCLSGDDHPPAIASALAPRATRKLNQISDSSECLFPMYILVIPYKNMPAMGLYAIIFCIR